MANFNKVSDIWSDDLLRAMSVTAEQIDAAASVRESARKDDEHQGMDLEIGRPARHRKRNPDLARWVNEFLAEKPKSRN